MKRKTILISSAATLLLLLIILAVGTGSFVRAGREGKAVIKVLEHDFDTTPQLGDLVNLAVNCYLPWGQDMPEALFIANDGIVQQGNIKVKTTSYSLSGRNKLVTIPICSYRTGEIAPGRIQLAIERNFYRHGPRKTALTAEHGKINFAPRKIEDPDQLPLAGKLAAPQKNTYRYIAWLVPAAVVLIVLILLAVKKIRSGENSMKAVLPPWEIARKSLAELRKTAEAGKQPLEWCVARLSDVVREYLSVRFNWQIRQQTTEEFFAELKRKRSPLSAAQTFYLEEFMKQSDLIKFANIRPDKDAFNQAVNRAEDLVEQTGENNENNAENQKESAI